MIEALGGPQVLQVAVVCQDGEGMLTSLQLVPPVLHGRLHGQQFTVPDIVILFWRGKFT